MLVDGTGLLAFAHGGNEAQKSMGVIALALVLSGRQSFFAIPPWVIVVSAATLVVGGVTGGWGIARTLGYGIYRLEPLPAGAGAAERPRGVRWDTGKTMILVWFLTFPAAAAAGLAVYGLVAAMTALAG